MNSTLKKQGATTKTIHDVQQTMNHKQYAINNGQQTLHPKQYTLDNKQ